MTFTHKFNENLLLRTMKIILSTLPLLGRGNEKAFKMRAAEQYFNVVSVYCIHPVSGFKVKRRRGIE